MRSSDRLTGQPSTAGVSYLAEVGWDQPAAQQVAAQISRAGVPFVTPAVPRSVGLAVRACFATGRQKGRKTSRRGAEPRRDRNFPP